MNKIPAQEKRPATIPSDPMAMLRATNVRLNRRNQQLEHIIQSDRQYLEGFMAGGAASSKRADEQIEQRLAVYKRGTRLEMSRLRGAAQVREPGDPDEIGTYLVLCYEWVGLANAKPAEPEWVIKQWQRRRNTDPGNDRWVYHWERRRWDFDTGFYENLEVVCWMHLPALR